MQQASTRHRIRICDRHPRRCDSRCEIRIVISVCMIVIKPMVHLILIKLAQYHFNTTYQYHSILIKVLGQYQYDTGKYSTLPGV